MEEKIKKIKKLNYLDDAILFMKSLLRRGKRDTAKAIKSVLLEICRNGSSYPGLVKYSDVKNMYTLHIPATGSEEEFKQGFRVLLIIMEYHVLATSIGPEYS